jgi:hypothetical protein
MANALRSIAGLVQQSVRGLLSADAGGGGPQETDSVVDGRRRIGWLLPVFEFVICGLVGEVDVVGFAAAGHPDVEVFAV